MKNIILDKLINLNNLIKYFLSVILISESIMIVAIVLHEVGINFIFYIIIPILLIIWILHLVAIIYLIRIRWNTFKELIRAIFLA